MPKAQHVFPQPILSGSRCYRHVRRRRENPPPEGGGSESDGAIRVWSVPERVPSLRLTAGVVRMVMVFDQEEAPVHFDAG